MLTPDGETELGCVYVYPSKKAGFDAVIRLWVTEAVRSWVRRHLVRLDSALDRFGVAASPQPIPAGPFHGAIGSLFLVPVNWYGYSMGILE